MTAIWLQMLQSLRLRILGRKRRTVIVLSAAAGLLSKGIGFVLLFAVVPLTLPHLGAERFGVLMTILSYGLLFGFVDFGIGSALIRETAHIHASEQPEELAQLLSVGLALMLVFGVVFSICLLLASRVVPIDRVFYRLPAIHFEETRDALSMFALLFAVALPLQGLQKVYQGLQRGYLTHAASALLSIGALTALHMSSPAALTMPSVVFWAYGVPALAPLVLLPDLFKRRLKHLRIDAGAMRAYAARLLRVGGLFLLLQLTYVLGWSIDGSLASALLGATSAGTLAVVQRLFQLVTVPTALINAPLWPAYADAAARGDRTFLRATFKRSMVFTTFIAGTAACLLVAFNAELMQVWFGRQLTIPRGLILLAAAMAVLESIGNSLAMYLHGLHILRPQLFVAVAFIALSIPLKFVLVKQFALEGLVASTLLCYVLCVVLPYITIFRHYIFAPFSSISSRTG